MRKNLLTIALALTSLAFAQQGGQNGGPGGGQNPQFRAQFEKFRPIFDLTSTVGLLDDLNKDAKNTITKAQAAKLVPVLKNLQTRADLKPADAEKILSQIEDSILTDAQVTKMDDLLLARQEEMRARRARQGNGGGQGGGLFGGGARPGGEAGQARPGGQNGQRGPGGGMFAAIRDGKPFNPFKEGRMADNLKTLIAALAKK